MTPAQRIRGWREDRGILRFVDEQFKASPDAWQEAALLAFASPLPEHRRISLQACAGPGKTAVLAWCGCWFLGVQGERDNHPNGACVSISRDNLKDNLWKEFAKWLAISPYMRSQFTWTANRIFSNDHPDTWFLSARAWPKSANADEQGKTLSGLHSKYVLAEIDESGAVPTTVLRAAEQALAQAAGGFGKLLQSGNPISLEGMLHAAANELRHQWHVIRITGDPDDPQAWVHAPRVGPEPLAWAKQQIDTYGRENPWVKSYILGQFPPASINSLLGIEEVEAAMKRYYKPDAYNWVQKRIGVDVARFGDDLNVIFPRQGLVAFMPKMMRNAPTTDIAARIARAQLKWAPDGEILIFVDDTGHWGHGVIDNLQTARISALPVIFSDPAINPRYRNRRAEMWLEMADWVKGGGALPPVRELVAELTVPTYSFVGGKFVLEDKDLIKARLGRSPNYADALALTFSMVDIPLGVQGRLAPRQTVLHNQADPFESAVSIAGSGHALHGQEDPFE